MNALAALLRSLPPAVAEKIYYRFLCGRGASEQGTVRAARLRGRLSAATLRAPQGCVIGDALFWTGMYEQHATRHLLDLASDEGGLLVDVGANLGYFSILWLLANPRNEAIAVEASPANIDLLRENLAINGLADRCRVHGCAAAAEDGQVHFDQGPRRQTGWGGISEGVGSGSRVITAPARRLDGLVERGRAVRLLKVDVEGAEALVLEGAGGLLETHAVREAWFEDNEPRRAQLGIAAERLTAPLTERGYTVARSTRGRRLPMDLVAKLRDAHSEDRNETREFR